MVSKLTKLKMGIYCFLMDCYLVKLYAQNKSTTLGEGNNDQLSYLNIRDLKKKYQMLYKYFMVALNIHKCLKIHWIISS